MCVGGIGIRTPDSWCVGLETKKGIFPICAYRPQPPLSRWQRLEGFGLGPGEAAACLSLSHFPWSFQETFGGTRRLQRRRG